MSIKARIIMMIGVLIAFIVVSISSGLFVMNKNNQDFTTLYVDRIVPLKDLKEIADMYAVNIVDTNHKLRNGQLNFEQASTNISNAQTRVKELWGKYMATTLTPEEAKLAQQTSQLMDKADESLVTLITAIKNQDTQAVRQFSIDQLYKYIDPVSDQISKLIDLQLRVAAELNAKNDTTYKASFTLAIIFSILVLAISIVLSLLTLRAILRPLDNLVSVTDHVVQNGDFEKRVPIERMDEVGQVSSAFNDLLEQTGKALSEANKTVDAIGRGIFTERMEGEFVGELLSLKEGVNASANSVSFMMDELGNIMQALEDGRLDAKMDEEVAESFRNLVEQAFGRTDQVIREINQVMQAVAEGDYSQRVEVEANGSFDVLKQSINNSVTALSDAMEEIKTVLSALRSGDLTTNMNGHYSGELQTIQTSLNDSINNLERIVTQASNAANIVLTASEEVSKGALDLSQRVQEQAAAVEETSATMEEMNSTVQNNTQNSSEAAILSKQMQDKTEMGTSVMEKTIEAMQSIERSSQRINDIVTLIDSIAFQTNLLALNAAVEAARAGEHGRGFAVVAGEVRGLAQKSADAAKDIKQLINESNERVSQGSELAVQSGEVLGEIKEAIVQVNEMIGQIAQSSTEQANGVNQVHMAINDIDGATQQNAALVEQTSAASESMAEQAQELSKEMAFFKVSNSRRLAAPAAAPKPAPVLAHNTSASTAPKAAPKQGTQQAATVHAIKPQPVETRKENDGDDWSEF
ncbi:methyl-accepting chemotaxis protein [Thiomicrorhabdus sp. ZW0627]|uniref:HAMP domain-containing methyl-accepting chemotaxis protein n=1 Tax=Thiomicrorhabdus sp. ZW0627 TaxID=3039774 RepID=UPI00243673A4|nr:methyl-accepting chemotaxis protein [Thiomicrorhabdus sp. ZW0627]MDG6773920.1 methyl-accepting chemotaxis protein [Thiomicrorhabdus sp. ZW0627]